MRAGWARSHCNENVARAYVFGGGHDGREAVLIGRDLRLRGAEEDGHPVSAAQRVAAQFTSRIGAYLRQRGRKRDWYSHHWICSGRAVGHRGAGPCRPLTGPAAASPHTRGPEQRSL